MDRKDYKPTPWELLKNHLMTIAEAGEAGGRLNFEDETVKVLVLANDVRDDMIKSLSKEKSEEKALLEEAAEDIKKFRNEVEFPRTSYDDKVYYQ